MDLHAAGFVHGDLKLSNIMWLPRENRWTLIDFGCAARTAETVPLRYSLKYSPPEVVHAIQQRRPTVVSTPAMDSWALGMIAVELLSSRSAIVMMEGRERVRAPRHLVPPSVRHTSPMSGRRSDVVACRLAAPAPPF